MQTLVVEVKYRICLISVLHKPSGKILFFQYPDDLNRRAIVEGPRFTPGMNNGDLGFFVIVVDPVFSLIKQERPHLTNKSFLFAFMSIALSFTPFPPPTIASPEFCETKGRKNKAKI